MNIFGKDEEEPQVEDTRVISNSLGIDLGTLNTVIAKPSGDKFDLYQIPSVVAVKKDDPSEVLAVGHWRNCRLDSAAASGKTRGIVAQGAASCRQEAETKKQVPSLLRLSVYLQRALLTDPTGPCLTTPAVKAV